MTVDALKDCNKRHLAQLAKERGITGWHAMRKDQLIRALSLPRATAVSGKGKTGSRPNGNGHPESSSVSGLTANYIVQQMHASFGAGIALR